jgi:hypothetical protein
MSNLSSLETDPATEITSATSQQFSTDRFLAQWDDLEKSLEYYATEMKKLKCQLQTLEANKAKRARTLLSQIEPPYVSYPKSVKELMEKDAKCYQQMFQDLYEDLNEADLDGKHGHEDLIIELARKRWVIFWESCKTCIEEQGNGSTEGLWRIESLFDRFAKFIAEFLGRQISSQEALDIRSTEFEPKNDEYVKYRDEWILRFDAALGVDVKFKKDLWFCGAIEK